MNEAPPIGAWVRVIKLEPPEMLAAVFVSEARKANRRLGAEGIVHSYVAGHGGDVWWVAHDAKTQTQVNPLTGTESEIYSDVAPYFTTEIEVVERKQDAAEPVISERQPDAAGG